MTKTSSIRDKNLEELITGISPSSDADQFPVEKLAAHINNVKHLAISIFVFHDDKLLIQQRAITKYHSGGLWANTVCSHPRWQESPSDCAQRRIQEELGWRVDLTEFGNINYAAQVGDLFENELVHCFIGRFDSDININQFNPEEVAALDWMTLDQIDEQIVAQPDVFTPWFKIYMSEYRSMIDGVHAAL